MSNDPASISFWPHLWRKVSSEAFLHVCCVCEHACTPHTNTQPTTFTLTKQFSLNSLYHTRKVQSHSDMKYLKVETNFFCSKKYFSTSDSWILGSVLVSLHGGTNTCVRQGAKEADKFAYHTNESNWETLSQRRKVTRMCALFKAYSGEWTWNAIWAGLIMKRKSGTGGKEWISGNIRFWTGSSHFGTGYLQKF